MRAEVLEPCDVRYIDATLLDEHGLVRVLPAERISRVDSNDLRMWLHLRAVYTLPTVELVAWLKDRISGRRAIEIGAGNGSVGRALGIPTTDSRMQERPEIVDYYRFTGQVPITYPNDVERLDASDAIKKYDPQVVIGAWITHRYDVLEHWRGGTMFGVDEVAIVEAGRTYIHIGAVSSHSLKPILGRRNQEYQFPWLAGRGDPQGRRIWVWPGREDA
jgi:hypothetical protein